jgi:hypothetical protein
MFNPQSLPLAWPLMAALMIVLGLVVIAAVYVALMARAAQWLYRAARV